MVWGKEEHPYELGGRGEVYENKDSLYRSLLFFITFFAFTLLNKNTNWVSFVNVAVN